MRVLDRLESHGIKGLEEYAIRCTWSPEGLLILNYTKGLSPKFDPIVRECRSLVVDTNYNLVSRSFFRFFNLGESPEHIFFNKDFRCHAKEDGSIVTLFNYDRNWIVRTRSTFGDFIVPGLNITWKQLFIRQLKINENDFQDWCNEKLNTDYSYTMELCSFENQNITHYDEDKLFLLSIFDGAKELDVCQVDKIAAFVGIERPKEYKFRTIHEAKEFVHENSIANPRFEGLVAVDKNFMRIKIKSPTYLDLHSKYDNGKGINRNSLTKHVLAGTGDDIVAAFPRCKKLYEECEKDVISEFDSICELYKQFSHIDSQRDFADAIKHHPQKGVLFGIRKSFGKNASRPEIWEVFTNQQLKNIRQ